jgi:hypothetical protein
LSGRRHDWRTIAGHAILASGERARTKGVAAEALFPGDEDPGLSARPFEIELVPLEARAYRFGAAE